jgi:glycosyltransferase involved in cell wall biosynthesis
VKNKSNIHVLHTLSGLHVAGVGRLLLQNIKALRKLDVTSTICYMIPNHGLRDEYLSSGFDPICLQYSSRKSALFTLSGLVRLIRRKNVSVIHTNHLLDRNLAVLAGGLTRTPVVTTFHDTAGREQKLQSRSRANLALDSFLYRRRLSAIIAVSQAAADTAVEAYGLTPENIRVIYSGVDTRDHDSDRGVERDPLLRESLSLTGAFPVLLNVARLHPMKGQRYLIPMMTKLREPWPDARLLIAGQGELRGELQTLIDAMNLQDHIMLLGRRSDVPDLMRAADVFVFPSLSEGLGMAVIEAMASGLPVVAADAGPLREVVIHRQTGVLVTPRDPNALAEGVAHILEGDHVANYGLASKARVQSTFNSMTTASEMKSVYKVCCSR